MGKSLFLMGKSLFSSFRSSVAKQVARFLLPVLLQLKFFGHSLTFFPEGKGGGSSRGERVKVSTFSNGWFCTLKKKLIAGLHVTSQQPCRWSRPKSFLQCPLGTKLHFHVNNFCCIDHQRGRHITLLHRLFAEKRPNFKVFLDDITMFERKPVIFKCRLSSKNLKTNITWYKDRQRIRDHKNFKILNFRWGSRLKIRRARVGDAGIYRCEVEGPGGTVTAQAQLKINKLNPPLERTQTTTSKVLFFSSDSVEIASFTTKLTSAL